jgi:uncharacterized protein (DUF488 family)
MIRRRRPALLTIGYQNRTVDDIIAALRAARVKVLVDVRLTPMSRKPGLSKNGLAARLHEAGIDYIHLPALGNPRDNRDSYRRGDEAAVAKYRNVLRTPEGQAALDQLVRLATQKRVALMCFEHDAAECHRSMVAGALVRAGTTSQVVHL